MPKSKREQKITLSRTGKKGRDRKQAIIDEVRECVDKYKSLYVFTATNMRNTALKSVRATLRSSRIFFGRNKLIATALGRTPSDEYADALHEVASSLLGGEAGLLFTDEPLEAVRKCFAEARVPEYARAGFKASEEVKLEEGPLTGFAHSMEPYLRKLKLPTRLTGGVITLLGNHTICRVGEELDANQTKLLQLLEIKMATFELQLVCKWSAGDFEKLAY